MQKNKHDELILEAKGFFDSHKEEIGTSIRENGSENIIFFNFEDLSMFSPKLSESLLDSPDETLELLESTLEDYMGLKNPRVRMNRLPKGLLVNIRDIRAKHLDKLIAIEGVIRQSSDIRPLLVCTKFECPNCGSILTHLGPTPDLRRCSCGWRSAFKTLSQEFVDQQKIIVEETPEAVETLNSQPSKINVFLEEDLVDPKMEKRALPGSRVIIYGILKEIDLENKGIFKGRREIILKANNIVPLEEDLENLKITEEDIKEFKKLSVQPDLLNTFVNGLAPSVYGYDEIKKAIMLQLFGGVRRKKSDSSYSRGDIHLLLIGDASTAKSVLIRNAIDLIPRARFVSGKSASGAGLTGTVQKDEATGQWCLEAGTMVLANNSLVGCDEIDKMNENDRNNLHEAMEAQQISFSKAGIQRTLNARTSLLAAANPKYGKFEKKSKEEFNLLKEVNLSPPLLSRFDCIFVIKDIVSLEKDGFIADKILSEHLDEKPRDILSHEFMKKYIVYARTIKPKLSQECQQMIKDFYISYRQAGSKADVIQIVARQLEGVIRLTQAHARMRLNDTTDIYDTKSAIEIVKEALKQTGLRTDGLIDGNSINSGIPQSQRQKMLLLREWIYSQHALGREKISLKELEKDLEGKFNPGELNLYVEMLSRSGDIYSPKAGWYSKL